MGLPEGITSNKLLLVEGKDEKIFIEKVLELANIPGTQVINVGGKDKFKAEFQTIARLSGFRNVANLGILRDAETDVANTLHSVRDLLKNHAIPVPIRAGEVLSDGAMRVGVWIMPDNVRAGSIEDLCWELISPDNPRRVCVEHFMECLRSNLQAKLEMDAAPPAMEVCFPKQPTKARLQAYLAGLHKIQREVGRAAAAGVWDLEHASLDPLRKFLSQLFG